MEAGDKLATAISGQTILAAQIAAIGGKIKPPLMGNSKRMGISVMAGIDPDTPIRLTSFDEDSLYLLSNSTAGENFGGILVLDGDR